MTLAEFRDILLAADPQALHYKSMQNTNYTRWQEYGAGHLSGDSLYIDRKWRIQVDRFTKIEYDPVVDLITSVLDRDDISFGYLCDFEPDTGYVHHVWDCEVA